MTYKNSNEDTHIETSLNYYFNISPQMEETIQATNQVPEVSYSLSSDFLPLKEHQKLIGFSHQITTPAKDVQLEDFELSFPGYKFEGWKIVRNNHNIIPHYKSLTQAALYAGEKSVIHYPGISDFDFLWRAGETFPLIAQHYSLYAQWSVIPYTIDFTAQTIYGLPLKWTSPSAHRTVEHDFEVHHLPQIHGYEFIGWKMIPSAQKWNLQNHQTLVPAGLGPVTMIALFDEEL